MLSSKPVRRPCHAKLKPGEYKRVPKAVTLPPVGYYFACMNMKCQFVSIFRTRFLSREHGLPVEEQGGELVSFGPFECSKCGQKHEVKGGSYVDS